MRLSNNEAPADSGRPAGDGSEERAAAVEEIARLKQEERASVQAVMESAKKRFYSSHRMHRTYLLHCYRDERLKIAPQRLGEVLGSVAADWLGMTDGERTLRSDFELRQPQVDAVLSGHAGGAHGLRRGSTRSQMAELNQITRGVHAYVRPDGPLAQRAKREALAEGRVAWYPSGGERLVLVMSDLELAVQEVLKHTPFQREGVSRKQAALMICEHPEVLLMYLQRSYFPVKLKDVQWMIKHSVRHWLQLAADYEVTDYAADRMRQKARDQRDETRKAWEAARKRQNEAMEVVQDAKVLQKQAEKLRADALREREEMAEARAELEREKMEVGHYYLFGHLLILVWLLGCFFDVCSRSGITGRGSEASAVQGSHRSGGGRETSAGPQDDCARQAQVQRQAARQAEGPARAGGQKRVFACAGAT